MLASKKGPPPVAKMFLFHAKDLFIRTLMLQMNKSTMPLYEKAVYAEGALFFLQFFCSIAGLPPCSKDERVMGIAQRVVDDIEAAYVKNKRVSLTRLRVLAKKKGKP